jgi:translocation and assembly module TamA
MRSTIRSLRFSARLRAFGIALALLHWGPLAYAQPALSGSLKSGLRAVIDNAESGSFFGSPTIEQRIDAGLVFLRAEGYYGSQIEIHDGVTDPVASPASDGFLVAVPDDARQLIVRPGLPFTISAISVTFIGPESAALDQAKNPVNALTSALINTPARATAVLNGQSQTLVSIREAGFTGAQDRYPDIIIDHATATMSITYTITAGPLVKFGEVIVTGAQLTPKHWVAKAAAVQQGETATADRLRDIGERFRLTGAYQNAEVSLAPIDVISDTSASADVAIVLQERTRRNWSIGTSWSTSNGIGIDATTSRFHRFRRADTLTYDARLGTLDSSLGASLRLPSFGGPSRDLFLEGRAGQETTDAFDRLIARLSATYALPRGRRDLLTYGLGLDVTRTRTPDRARSGIVARDIDGADLSLLMRYDRDRTNDVINPSTGWQARGEIQPSVFVGDGDTLPYARLVLGGSRYNRLPALRDGVIAARLRAGILIANNDQLPFDRRFFAGGGGSVRGYPFQSIGPRDLDDNPIGGASLIEGSLEARWSVRGPFGIAIFADGGRVGALDGGGLEETKFGLGIGLRYNLGLAPLRFDIAFPVSPRAGDPPVQLYLSAGQAF